MLGAASCSCPLEPVRTEAMERLRSKKAAVTSQLDERRASARFEPQVDADAGAPQRDLGRCPPRRHRRQQQCASSAPAASADESAWRPEQDTYTERLMAAKKKARKDMGG